MKLSAIRQAPPFDSLLDRLAADPESAHAYEGLRLRLVCYFRLRFPVDAEALADETIDRLARRLSDGTPVVNLAAYALGIARLIGLETATRQRREREAALTASIESAALEAETEPDAALPALQCCLAGFDQESVSLILEYYTEASGAARIEHRQHMAERHGLTPNALRNRALRIRIALERCVRARLGDADHRPKRHSRLPL